MIMRMVAQLKTRFDLSVPIGVLFTISSIAELSDYLEWQESENNQANEEEDTSMYEILDV